jgi:hypothetical protein
VYAFFIYLGSMWHYFDRIYCINLDARHDRWAQVYAECVRVGFRPIRTPGVMVDHDRVLGFNLAQIHALATGLESGADRFMIIEDDVMFKNLSHLSSALSELPVNYDMVYLGANVREERPVFYSQHLRVLRDAWTTHAVGYTKESALSIMAMFDPNGKVIYDEWLRVNILPQGRSYIVAPQVAVQRPSYSDIWQTHADYTSLYDEGNKKLL